MSRAAADEHLRVGARAFLSPSSPSSLSAYDSNGNRTSASGGDTIGSVVIDGQDRLTQQTKNSVQTTYTYRNNGSLWTSTSPAAAWSFLYDLQGNLQTATKSGTSLAYLVDGLNRRVGKTGTGATHTAKYVYDGQLRVAAELDAATGAVTHVYAYGEKATTPELVYEPATTKTYRIVSDVRGSVRLVLEVPATVAGGAPVVRQRIDYDAWGVASEWVNLTGDASFKRVSLGFAGGVWDRDTGLVRFGARDYEPGTGRWTTKDPIRFNGGDTNLYAYAANDPINHQDTTGLYLDAPCLDSIKRTCAQECSSVCPIGPFVAACTSTCVLIQSAIESKFPGALCDNKTVGAGPRNCWAESQAVLSACYFATGDMLQCEKKAVAYFDLCAAGKAPH